MYPTRKIGTTIRAIGLSLLSFHRSTSARVVPIANRVVTARRVPALGIDDPREACSCGDPWPVSGGRSGCGFGGHYSLEGPPVAKNTSNVMSSAISKNECAELART